MQFSRGIHQINSIKDQISNTMKSFFTLDEALARQPEEFERKDLFPVFVMPTKRGRTTLAGKELRTTTRSLVTPDVAQPITPRYVTEVKTTVKEVPSKSIKDKQPEVLIGSSQRTTKQPPKTTASVTTKSMVKEPKDLGTTKQPLKTVSTSVERNDSTALTKKMTKSPQPNLLNYTTIAATVHPSPFSVHPTVCK